MKLAPRKQAYWVKPREPYYCQTGSMFENPHGVPHDEIYSMMEDMTPEVIAQVVYGKYVDLSGLVFSADLINQMFDRRLPKVKGSRYLNAYAAQQSSLARLDGRFDLTRFATGVDLARKKDKTVITVLDTAEMPARVVYWRSTNRVPWDTIYAEVGLAQYLFPGETLIDETGIGDVVKEALESRMYCPTHSITFEATGQCPGGRGMECRRSQIFRIQVNGYVKTQGTKRELVNHLQGVLGHGYDANDPGREFGLIRSPVIQAMEDEFPAYAWEDKKLDTDSVMSMGLAAWQGIQMQVGDSSIGSPHGEG